MLSQLCKIDDLNPQQWRRLTELAFPRRSQGRVYLLHQAGKPIRLFKNGADLPLPTETILDPQAAADKLKAEHADCYEAWVLDPDVFAQSMSGIHAQSSFDTEADVFALFEYEERMKIPGHAISPKSGLIWRGAPIKDVQRFVEKMLPDSCTFVLGVFDGDQLWASLLVQFQDKKIVAINTTDALPFDDVKDIIGRDQHPFFLNVVANTFRRPAFGWFVERAEFEAWMKAADEGAKQEVFQRAIMDKKATFDFSILVDRGITAFSPINPGEAAIAGMDREANPRTRTPDPSENPPTAI